MRGVPPPAWATKGRAHFEPSLGGTSAGRTTRSQAYKENRLATGAYFAGTVAGASLVAKSHSQGPLSGTPKRPSSAAPRRQGLNPVTAGRPQWIRPTSGLAATKASLARPDREQLRAGPGGGAGAARPLFSST